MPGFIKTMSGKIGLLPGMIIPVGAEKTEKAQVTLYGNEEARFEERTIQ